MMTYTIQKLDAFGKWIRDGKGQSIEAVDDERALFLFTERMMRVKTRRRLVRWIGLGYSAEPVIVADYNPPSRARHVCSRAQKGVDFSRNEEMQ